MSNQDAWQLAQTQVQRGESVVLVSLADVQGSAPREPGACLAVTATSSAGSIGGGRLEWQATAQARERLEDGAPWQLDTVTLNADIGQCCGGRVHILHERLTAADTDWLSHLTAQGASGSIHTDANPSGRTTRWSAESAAPALDTQDGGLRFTRPVQAGSAPVLLFGAGHIGLALARLLTTLPVNVHHVDTRDQPEHPTVETVAHPEALLRDAPENSLVLIMTHDHALDYRIAEAALAQPAVRWVGLVGSASKRQQLSNRLKRKLGPDAADTALRRLSCPIGRTLTSRSPNEMAAIIAAELLYARDNTAH